MIFSIFKGEDSDLMLKNPAYGSPKLHYKKSNKNSTRRHEKDEEPFYDKANPPPPGSFPVGGHPPGSSTGERYSEPPGVKDPKLYDNPAYNKKRKNSKRSVKIYL